MKIHSDTRSALKAMGVQSALAMSAGTALFVISSSAFAQIKPDVKMDIAAKVNRIAPGDKCGHNPPDDKVVRTGDTRMLLPAVKLVAQTKTLDAPHADTTACPKAK